MVYIDAGSVCVPKVKNNQNRAEKHGFNPLQIQQSKDSLSSCKCIFFLFRFTFSIWGFTFYFFSLVFSLLLSVKKFLNRSSESYEMERITEATDTLSHWLKR